MPGKEVVEHERHLLWKQVLPQVKVCKEGDVSYKLILTLPEHIPLSTVRVQMRTEHTTKEEEISNLSLKKIRTAEFPFGRFTRYILTLPGDLAPGYYEYTAKYTVHLETLQARTKVIVSPKKCFLPEFLNQKQKIWGISSQLYSLQSERNWGVGDFSDLSTLENLVCQGGGAFIGLNPLHPLPLSSSSLSSPYSPTSRSGLSLSYLDVEAVSEFKEAKDAQALVESAEFKESLKKCRESELINYGAVVSLKLSVVRVLYKHFFNNHILKKTPRGEEFEKFVFEEEDTLKSYALFEALSTKYNSSLFDTWPKEYHSPDTPQVKEFEKTHFEEITFFKYLQWLLHLQVENFSKNSQLPLGLYLDLALSADRFGVDVWKKGELYAKDLEVGCPPDEYNPAGQNWGFPPVKPRLFRTEAYQSFIEALRSSMRYAGALRLDHVMSLFRLFCIPKGMHARKGSYVTYPLRDLLGIVALESMRNKCFIVGEDLGTVPNIVRTGMEEYGIFSYKVHLFMKDGAGRFTPASFYPKDALVTSTTHDMATLWGYWNGEDIRLRNSLNLYPTPKDYEQELTKRENEKRNILLLLQDQGLLPPAIDSSNQSSELNDLLFKAIIRHLLQTPSQILALPLEDLVKQYKQVNLPGVVDGYPSWRHRIPKTIESLLQDETIRDILLVLQERRGLTPIAK